MNTATALRLLKNSGFHDLRADTQFIYMEDPTCILRSFATFLEYVWGAMAIIAGCLLVGWGISLVRGAKYKNIFVSLKNLLILFLSFALIRPVLTLIYGEDLLARGCKTISISIEEMNKLLDLRKQNLSAYNEFNLYEDMVVEDSGVVRKGSEKQVSVDSSETAADSETNGDTSAKSATESGDDVIYTMPDGSRVKRTGGTQSWRDNNPGNITNNDLAKESGAIGSAQDQAVFPDESTGMSALEDLLRANDDQNVTISGAISRYVPPNEKDSVAYYRKISDLTGLSVNKRISDLTPAEMTSLAEAIRTTEGWNAGQEERM